MVERKLRAVLLDAHGGLFEKETPDDNPEQVGQVGREFWVQCFIRAINEFTQQTVTIDPTKLWHIRMEVELHEPREWQGRVIPQGRYYDRVNERILITLFPKLVSTWRLGLRSKIARRARQLHRGDRDQHIIYQDMRQLVHDIHQDGLQIFIVTAQEPHRLEYLLNRNNAPRKCLTGTFTTTMIGASKLRKEYWTNVLRRANLQPNQAAIIDNNTVQGSYGAVCGIPALILDRDGAQKDYFLRRGQKLRGVPLLTLNQSLPVRGGTFIGFARDVQELRFWLRKLQGQE